MSCHDQASLLTCSCTGTDKTTSGVAVSHDFGTDRTALHLAPERAPATRRNHLRRWQAQVPPKPVRTRELSRPRTWTFWRRRVKINAVPTGRIGRGIRRCARISASACGDQHALLWFHTINPLCVNYAVALRPWPSLNPFDCTLSLGGLEIPTVDETIVTSDADVV